MKMMTGMAPETAVAAFVTGYLDQTEALLEGLPQGVYARHVPAVGGSIGGHVRHCLDHVQGALRALESGEVYFERRDRDPKVAVDPSAALDWLRRLRMDLGEAAAVGALARPVAARTSLSGDLAASVALPSTLARELVYVGLHFVHHLALVATAARLQGLAVDPLLGRAPATLHHERALPR